MKPRVFVLMSLWAALVLLVLGGKRPANTAKLPLDFFNRSEGAAGISASGTAVWRIVAPAVSPSARANSAFAFDSTRSKFVLFGGWSSTGSMLNDTWEYDGTNWMSVTPSHRPSARSVEGNGMVYDSARRRIVLFGGWQPPMYELGDTWEYNGADWVQITTGSAPTQRNCHGMVYRTAAGRVVLFGGWEISGSLMNDTWEYDGATWTKISTLHRPPPRRNFGIAYDSARDRVIVFGGCSGRCSSTLDDTWEFDGTDWHEVITAASPGSRAGHSMIYDSSRRRVVMFGGCSTLYNFHDCVDGPLSETWEYDGGTWTPIHTPVTPSPRHEHMLGYDNLHAKTLLFGGRGGASSMLADTWEYGGTATQSERILPDRAVLLVKEVLEAPYLWGGKGYDPAATLKKFFASQTVKEDGYNYWNRDKGEMDSGTGLDCSGLVLWAYNRAWFGDRELTVDDFESRPVYWEGADMQYRANVVAVAKELLRPGDLLFFDEYPVGDVVMNHVAMYVGPFSYKGGDYNAIHASGFAAEIVPAYHTPEGDVLTTTAHGTTQTLAVDRYGRVKDARAPRFKAKSSSPVDLIVIDPEGETITKGIGASPSMEYLTYDIDGDGELNDIVSSPERKLGNYSVRVVPEPGAIPTDTYSLEVTLDGQTIVLAQDVPISDIPDQPYVVESKCLIQLPIVTKSHNY